MRGRLFTVVSGLALLLCIGTCALWVRSYWHGDRVDVLILPSAYRQTPMWLIGVISGRGGLGFSVAHSCTYYADEATWRREVERRPASRIGHNPFPAVYPRWTAGDSGWSA